MSMKDLLNKMTELQGTTKEEKVTTTGKKILNESIKPVVKESTKPSLKSMFNALLAEAEQVTIQPAKQNTQVIKQGDKTLGTVTNPNLANQIKQSIGKGEMSLAGDELNEVDDDYDGDDYDHDDGSDQYATELHGLHLGDVVKANYNGKTVIGKISELHPTYLEVELELTGRNAGKTVIVDVRETEYVDNLNEAKLTEKAKSKSQQQAAGAALAAKRGDAPKSKLKGASKEMAKMPAKELEKFAKTKHKGLPEKKKTDEAALPTNDSDFGAGLGAGRNSKTLEAKKAKPDFLDLDKDGNKKESMKKAAADKQKVSTMKKTNEAKAKPDFLDLDKDGNKKEPMKKAAADKKTGSDDKKSSAGLTAAQKKLPAGLQKAAADAKKKVTVKEGERVNEISTDLKQRARDKATDLANTAADKNHHMAQKVRTDQANKFQAGIENDFKKNKRKAERDSLSPAQRRKLDMMEGTNPTESARLLGKAHAMANDTFSCKYEEGSQEAQAYLDGYKSGLDECYGLGSGMGMQQDIGMMPGMDSMVSQDSMMDTPSPRGGSEFAFGGFDDVSDDDMMAFESWDRELNALLNEGKMKDIDIDMKQMSDAEFKKEHGKSKADMKKDLSYDKKPVKEGISVSVSKGQQGSPDSVTVSAQDQDADALLAMIKQAGLGLFGGNEPSGYGSPASAATQPTGDVGDHDSMMALIKKMSSTGNDYEDEDDQHVHGHPDAACDNCGSATCEGGSCSSSSKETMMGEVQTPGQEEFEVAEANAPDSDEAETTADENAEAKEDQALAGADSGDEEEINEDSSYPTINGKQVNVRSIEIEGGTVDDTADTYVTYAEFTDGTPLSDNELNELSDDNYLMSDLKMNMHEGLNEWANDAGYQGSENMKDNTFEQDIEFMTRVISGGLNGPKKDQTTLPHTRVKVEESRQVINEWKKLSGIK